MRILDGRQLDEVGLSAAEAAAAHSTWARRLRAGTSRLVWLVRLERAGTAAGTLSDKPSRDVTTR